MEDIDARPFLGARHLRYFICVAIRDAQRPLTVADLVRELERSGFRIKGRPSKSISHCLRWAVRRGWVVRVRRSTYGVGRVARSTDWWMRNQLASAHQNEIVALTLAAGDVTAARRERRVA